MCERERQRTENMCERETENSECVCVCERENICGKERVFESVCVREREGCERERGV